MLQNRKNGKNRLKWCKNCPTFLSHESVILETLFIFHIKWKPKFRMCCIYVILTNTITWNCNSVIYSILNITKTDAQQQLKMLHFPTIFIHMTLHRFWNFFSDFLIIHTVPEINISPVTDNVSGSRHFVPVTRNLCRSSVYDILLKFENLPVIVTGRKRILSITHGIVPDSDRWPAVISCTALSSILFQWSSTKKNKSISNSTPLSSCKEWFLAFLLIWPGYNF